MSKNQAPKKKVVTTSPASRPQAAAQRTRVLAPERKVELVFQKNNFILLGAAAVLMVLGIILMSGGKMPDPNTWDDNIIYSPRIMVVAPILMVAGIVAGIVAIFRR